MTSAITTYTADIKAALKRAKTHIKVLGYAPETLKLIPVIVKELHFGSITKYSQVQDLNMLIDDAYIADSNAKAAMADLGINFVMMDNGVIRDANMAFVAIYNATTGTLETNKGSFIADSVDVAMDILNTL